MKSQFYPTESDIPEQYQINDSIVQRHYLCNVKILEWEGGRMAELPWPTGNLADVMGGSARTLRALICEYLFFSQFQACAESHASQNASRLAVMQHAEKEYRKNAGGTAFTRLSK